MSVFVNYDGPKLGKEQKIAVRSQAMVSYRDQARKARAKSTVIIRVEHIPDPVTGANSKNSNKKKAVPISSSGIKVNEKKGKDDASDPHHPGIRDAGSGLEAGVKQTIVVSQRYAALRPRPRELGQPPSYCHATGIDAVTFRDYLWRCGTYSSYLDEAFSLVGWYKPSYFRPDMSKAACVYIGWLITSGMLDAGKGTATISYPYYEMHAVRELQKFLDQSETKALGEVVYPVVILGIFEMIRFGPNTLTHMAAVESFIKMRGGIRTLPQAMQELVYMTDLLQCICLNTPLAYGTVDPPISHMTAINREQGSYLLSSPLLLCDAERFSSLDTCIDGAAAVRLGWILERTSNAIQRFFNEGEPTDGIRVPDSMHLDLEDAACGPARVNDLAGLVLQSCAVASQITLRALDRSASFEDPVNKADMRLLYDNLRFLGLRSWAGMPYVYLWVVLIGIATSTGGERSYFVAQLVRSAYSHGGYQIDVFATFLKNFMYLRQAVSSIPDE